MLGDQADFTNRITQLLPQGWFPIPFTVDFSGFIFGQLLNVQTAKPGTILPNMLVQGPGVASNTVIVNQLLPLQFAEVLNGRGRYNLNISQPTVTQETMTGSINPTPILSSLIDGISNMWAWMYGSAKYAQLQTRISTATEQWLDLISYDYLGNKLPRLTNETDRDFGVRIVAEILRTRNTRYALLTEITALTGFAPYVFEPRNAFDCGAYNVGSSLAYNTPGLIVSFNASITDNIVTVTSVPVGGHIQTPMLLEGGNIPSNTEITGQVLPLIAGESIGGIGRYTISVLGSPFGFRLTSPSEEIFGVLTPKGVGGYGSMVEPFQVFIHAYLKVGSPVGGYGGPNYGYGIGSGEYIPQPGVIRPPDLYNLIVNIIPAGTTAWVTITDANDATQPAPRRYILSSTPITLSTNINVPITVPEDELLAGIKSSPPGDVF